MNDNNILKSMFAMICTFFTYLFGGWDTALIALVVFMVLDFLSGWIAAIINNKLDSHVGFKGILKKSLILSVLIIAVLLDRLLNNDIWVFRTLVCYFYIANEGLSILENAGKCGIKLPHKLLKSLQQLQEKKFE